MAQTTGRPVSPLAYLTQYIRDHGPIPTVRVSSAQSHTQYPYWGAVRYEIRLTREGCPTNTALERASSDRRSERLADRDADKIAAAEGRVRYQGIGRLDNEGAMEVLGCLGVGSEVVARFRADQRKRDERLHRRRTALPMSVLDPMNAYRRVDHVGNAYRLAAGRTWVLWARRVDRRVDYHVAMRKHAKPGSHWHASRAAAFDSYRTGLTDVRRNRRHNVRIAQMAARLEQEAADRREQCDRQFRRIKRRLMLTTPSGEPVGRRCWVCDDVGYLYSPHRGHRWDGPVMRADDWTDEHALQDRTGVFAFGLGQRVRVNPTVHQFAYVVWGRVRGVGRTFAGTFEGGYGSATGMPVLGWRSEGQVVDCLDVPSTMPQYLREALAERYQCRVRVRPPKAVSEIND